MKPARPVERLEVRIAPLHTPAERAAAGKTPRTKHRRWRLGEFAAAALSISLVACAMGDTSTFNSSIWKEQRGAALHENKRLAMLDDLESRIHPGMSRGEVLDMLGPPDTSDPRTHIDTYELGVSPAGIDGEVYRIEYVNDNVVGHRWSRW